MSNELAKELEYFKSHLDELMAHSPGQFALIKDDELLGTFSEFDDAFKHGVDTLGNVPFLVRKISEIEPEIQVPALVLGLLNARL